MNKEILKKMEEMSQTTKGVFIFTQLNIVVENNSTVNNNTNETVQIGTLKTENLYDVHDNKTVKL